MKNKITTQKKGMTIVELMVALTIMMIVTSAIYSIVLSQRKAYIKQESITETQEIGKIILTIIKRDLMMAGYGVDKKLALYIKDGGDNGPDELYINDWSFIDENELLAGVYGETKIIHNSGKSILVEKLNLDDCAQCSDNTYGDSNDPNEFESQYVISDTDDPEKKVAKIKNVNRDTNTLTLQEEISGSYVAPAIYYGIVEENLKKSTRNTGGRQPLAQNVVDLQIAYQDKEGNWYCHERGSSPMTPFDPSKIRLIRVSIVIRTKAKTDFNKTTGRPALENREEGEPDNYSYRIYTTTFVPRNLFYGDI